MKTFLFIILCFIINSSFSQEFNKYVYDEKVADSIVVGNCNYDVFSFQEHMTWYDMEFNDYLPEKELLDSISLNKKPLKIQIVLGFWCHDSQREVPRFLKIIELVEKGNIEIEFIAVDTKKQAGKIDIAELQVELVPTFIFYNNNSEIGRIIETPQISLEKDFLDIINF